MPPKVTYGTRLEQWKRELSAELERDVTYEEIAQETDLAYSTLQKHVSHRFRRPDFATAAIICSFFNERSTANRKRSPLDYFVAVEEGEAVAVA